MPLVECPDCKSPVSDLASSCTKCGRPMNSLARPFTISQSKIVLILSAVTLIFSFFLPWGTFSGLHVSGYQIAQFGSYGNWALIIPIGSIITITLELFRNRGEISGLIVGVFPSLVIFYFLLREIVPLEIFQLLGFGAYLTFITSIVLLFISLSSFFSENFFVDPKKLSGSDSVHLTDWVLLFSRISLGGIMMYHGFPQFIKGPIIWEKLGMAMANFGVQFSPVFWGFMASSTQSFGGLFLVIGVFSRISGFFLAFTMFVATSFHFLWNDTFFKFGYPMFLCLFFLGISLAGGGRISLGARISFLAKKWWQ